MAESEVTRVLNRLYQILSRSLPVYLADARPFVPREQGPLQDALSNVAADQRTLADRVARSIIEQGANPEPGRFPMQFAAENDLEIDFLLRCVIQRQRQDVESLKRCAAELSDYPQIQSLAEEAQGNAEGHLEILEGMMNAE